jgi:hypothetical protein
VEPTGADSPSQNGGVEHFNQTLGTMTHALLYGASLPVEYWSYARGSGGKMTIFSNGSYDQCKYPDPPIYTPILCIKSFIEKNEWKIPFGGVKVDIFAPRTQQVGLVLGFW